MVKSYFPQADAPFDEWFENLANKLPAIAQAIGLPASEVQDAMLFYSAQVNSSMQFGDYEKAEIASLNAKKWTNIAVITGVCFGIISLLISLLSKIS